VIDYNVKHIPLITFQTSGDSFVIKEIEDKFYFSVIDIAGHGTSKCFFNAKKIKKIIESSIGNTDFFKIFKKLHNELFGDGAVVLIGYINIRTGEYEYSSIGNISIKKILINKNTVKLKTQEGMIGINIPNNIEIFNGRLEDKEYLFVHTDGVKSNINLSKYFIYNSDVNKISRIIIENERNVDDALGLLLRYRIENR